MLRGVRSRLARARGGQTGWSPSKLPSVGAGGAAPPILSGNEGLQLAFRPLPREHTVEYEEDRGNNIYIQREYVSPRAEKEMPARWHGIGRSRTELQDLRRQFAAERNEKLNAQQRSVSQQNSPQFVVSTDDNDPVGTIQSAKYVFDEKRMQYLLRFERHFGKENLRPLAETCAVLYGMEGTEEEVATAREGFLAQFLQMDAKSLESEAEAATEAMALAEEGIRVRSEDEDDADEGDNREALVKLPGEYADFADLYANFAAYCRGDSPVAAPGAANATVGRSNRTATRHRWREILMCLAAEEYHRVNAEMMPQLEELSERLNTVRLFGAKLGEIVKEAAQLGRAAGAQSHSERTGDAPATQSAANPGAQRRTV
jgi:hypothetical protein